MHAVIITSILTSEMRLSHFSRSLGRQIQSTLYPVSNSFFYIHIVLNIFRCLDVWQLDMGQLSWINFTIPSNSDSIWYRLPWSIVHSQFPSYCAQPTDYSWYIYKNMAQRSVFLYYCCPQSIADKCIFNKTYISLLLQSTVYSQ